MGKWMQITEAPTKTILVSFQWSTSSANAAMILVLTDGGVRKAQQEFIIYIVAILRDPVREQILIVLVPHCTNI